MLLVDCVSDALHGAFDIVVAVEGADTDIAITAGAETNSRCNDHTGIIQ